MGKYGNAAIRAAKLVKSGEVKLPVSAWRKATGEIFGEETSSQDKGCPRGAFLGLCEEGMIKGIPSGRYTQSTSNKEYAIKAVRILKEEPTLNQKELWAQVTEGKVISHNGQIDVVLSF